MSLAKKIEHVYEEASKLFARKGYEGVSMRDVAEAAGITLATLTYHFSSKNELYEEVTQYRLEKFIGDIVAKQKKLPAGSDTPSSLLALIFDAVFADATYFNLIQHDLLYFDADHRLAHTKKKYAACLGLVADTVRRCRGNEPDEAIVFAMAALVTGYCELVQADPRSSGETRENFLQYHRTAMIEHAQRAFDYLP